MNPDQQPLTPYQQRLRDEVIYLHSLWHQGPPSPNPISILYTPTSVSTLYTHLPSRNLHVFNSTSFKKTKRNPHTFPNPNNTMPSVSGSHPQPDPGPAWPVDQPPPSSPPADSGWPSFKDRSSPETRIMFDIDDSKVAVMRMQQKVVKLCNDFFAKRVDLDCEEVEELGEEDGEDGYFSDDKGVEESDEFKFLFGLFVENREMRDFYESNQDTGDFYCLVCGGVGEKVGKMFKGSLGLVQHAIAILKTKQKRAHRVFGLVICRVLGWDISRLPMIVLKGEPLSQSLANLGETLKCLKEDNCQKIIEDTDNGVSVVQESTVVHRDETFLGEDDGSKANKELVNGIPDAGTGKERIMECLQSEPSLASDVHWPCPKLLDESLSAPSGGPSLNLLTSSLVRNASFAEELGIQLQQRSLEECQKFFANSSCIEIDKDGEDGTLQK